MSQLSIKDDRSKLVNDLVSSLPTIRHRLGISQSILAECVGLSRQSISSIERRYCQLTWTNYLAIVMFLTANNTDVFYFPRYGEYKYINEFKRLTQIKNLLRGK